MIIVIFIWYFKILYIQKFYINYIKFLNTLNMFKLNILNYSNFDMHLYGKIISKIFLEMLLLLLLLSIVYLQKAFWCIYNCLQRDIQNHFSSLWQGSKTRRAIVAAMTTTHAIIIKDYNCFYRWIKISNFAINNFNRLLCF